MCYLVYRKLLREKKSKKHKQICLLHIRHTEAISDRKQILWTGWGDIQNSFCLVTVHLWNFCLLVLPKGFSKIFRNLSGNHKA